MRIGVLVSPDASIVVTAVMCDLCDRSFGDARGLVETAALMMLSSHLQQAHGVIAGLDRFDVDRHGREREVRLSR